MSLAFSIFLVKLGKSFQKYSLQILRAMLFCSKQDRTNLLYFKLRILKLEDMITMEYAKFILKFNNHMLPDSFNCCFTKLENVHKYNTKQIQRNEYFQFCISSELGRKTLHISVFKCGKMSRRNFATFHFQCLENISNPILSLIIIQTNKS